MGAATASTPLIASLRARLKAWALRRQGRDVLPVKLRARRIYILPSTAGWTFALLLGVMFIAGMNYGNGLALLFTFWLTGFALVAMVQTQRVLTGITVHAATALPAHVGDQVMLSLTVRGPAAAQDLRISADQPGTGSDAAAEAARDGGHGGELRLALPAMRRGRWQAPPLRLATTAPFGLFRAWTWLTPEVSTIVYPVVAGGTRRPPDTAASEAGGLLPRPGHDELAWLRDFREGDSPRQVAWKAYARGQPLLVREYHGAGARRLEFDFEALPDLDVEARLSQLTRWVVDASAAGFHWTLRLPGSGALAGSGPGHRRLCLEHLALFGTGSPVR